MKNAEFLKDLATLADGLRQRIELQCEAFDPDPKAAAARKRRVCDPQTGYRYFCETYFPHYFKKAPSKLHEDLFTALPEITASPDGQKRLIVAPRGSAKSTHIAMAFPLWCVVTAQKHYIMLIMDAWEQAAIQLEAIKAELEFNPRLLHDFPAATGLGRIWRAGMIITANDILLETFGTGKKIRGRRHGPHRPDLVILDDLENDENVESPRQRDKLERWLSKAVLKLGSTSGEMDVLYAGTVLHFDAVIVRMSQKPGWKVSRYRALIRWPDRMDLWDEWEARYLNDQDADGYYRAHKKEMDAGAEINWPAQHSLIYLMRERAGDHDSFESEYQNNPIDGGGAFRNPTWFVAAPEGLLYFGAIDPSLGKKNAHRDPSAIVIGGYAPTTGKLYIVEASIRRRVPDDIIEDAIALHTRYRCQMWFVESVQFQEFFRTEAMTRAAKRGVAMPCKPVIPIADKKLRIERLQPPFAHGLILLNNAHQTLIDEFKQFPSGKHDDGLDAVEMLWTGALEMAGQFFNSGAISIKTQPNRLEGY